MTASIIRRAWEGPTRDKGLESEEADGTTEVMVYAARSISSLDLASQLPRKAAGGNLRDALHLVRRLCEPLAHIHSRGHIHGDLTPKNIIVRSDGQPVLVDFGLAARHAGATGREHLGGLEQIRGTIAYMAPERIRGLPCDPRMDLYALGCVLYELLTGFAPFQGETKADVMGSQLIQVPTPPSRRVEGIDDDLDDLVLGLLEKDPRDRIGYAEDVAHRLTRWFGEDPSPIERPSASYLYRPGLVGRDELVKQLSNEVTAASAGHGRVVLLGGESGIGKTCVAAEVARIGRENNMRVISGECISVSVGDGTTDDFAAGAPLHPLKPLLVAIADVCRTAEPLTFARVLGPRARLLAPYEQTIAELAQFEESPVPPSLPPEAAQQRLLAALHETVLQAFGDQPLLLIVDDLQWADELTLAFLATLDKRGLTHQAVLVLCTYRSEEIDSSLRALIARPFVTTFELERLDKPAIVQVVADMLAMREPPDHLTNWLAKHSEGIPFYVAEYVRLAVVEKILVRRQSRWSLLPGDRLPDDKNLPLPDTLRGVLERRLHSLSETQLAWLQKAAVIGREIDLDLFSAFAGEHVEAMLACGQELYARHLLEIGPTGARRFSHDKLRELVYSMMSATLRRRLHAECGAALEARLEKGKEQVQFPLLAHHFYEAEDYRKATYYLEKSGELALSVSSGREAARHLEGALVTSRKLQEDSGDQPGRLQRVRRSRQLAEAHILAGDRASADKHLREGLLVVEAAAPHSRIGWVLRLLREVIIRITIGLGRKRAPPTRAQALVRAEALHLYHLAAEHFIYKNALVPAFWALFRTINVAESLPPTGTQARGLALAALALDAAPLLRRLTERWAKRAIDIAESLRDSVTSAYVLSRVAIMSIHRGRMSEAEDLLTRSIALAKGVGYSRFVEEAMSILAMSYRYVGRFLDAMVLWREVRTRAELRDDKQVMGWAMMAEAEDALRIGRDNLALSTIDAASTWLESGALDTERAWGKAVRALIVSRHRRHEEALSLAMEVVADLKRAPPFVYFLQPAVGALAETLLDLWEENDDSRVRGQRIDATARGAVKVLMRFAARFPFAMATALHQRGRYNWLRGREQQAIRDFEHAQEIANALGLIYDEGRCALERARHTQAATRWNFLATAVRCLEKTSASHELAEARGQLGARVCN